MIASISSLLQHSEGVFLCAALILILSIFAGKFGSRFGVPMLLIFLGVGMLFGSDGLGIQFGNLDTARSIGILALIIILFSGGMDTNFNDVRPILAKGISLATVGVLITAALTGLFTYYIFLWAGGSPTLSMAEALLLAAVMASTDSASVFSILQGRKVQLKEHLNRVLELESGSNDPMAYLLTIMLISYITMGNMSISSAVLSLVIEITVGALVGFLLGKAFVWIINKVDLGNESFYPIFLFAGAILIFALTNMVHGNGYLAVYIAGLVIGNTPFVHKRRTRMFFEGFTWLFQIVMFLTLGLLVNPRELWPVAGVAVVIGVFMILIARPLAVFVSLLPFKKSFSSKGKIYLSWVGLKGAVPIIFAIYPLTNGVEHAQIMFNVVFFITIVSLLTQGTTVVSLAKWLNLTENARRKDVFGIELPEEIKSAMSQIDITPEILKHGNKLMELTLPDHTLAVMVMRDSHYFIPKGNTPLQENDKLLIISDNDEALLQAYQSLGITDYTMQKN